MEEWQMKTINMVLVLLFSLALWPKSSGAQGQQNAISIDVFLPIMSPVSLLSGEEMAFLPLNVKYQRVIVDHLVLMLKGGLNYNWDNSERILDIYPMVELDWHPFQSGLKGFYTGFSGFFNYSSYHNSTEDADHNYRAALGGTLGWQFVLQSRIIIDLTLGLGYGYNVEVDVNGNKTSDWSLDETIGGVFVGFCF
jgi:hypothetical protein